MELSERQLKRIRKISKYGEDKDIANMENLIEIDEKVEELGSRLDSGILEIKEELKKKLESELVLEIDREELKGEDGYTPIKGKDYFDGKDGENYVLTISDRKEIAKSIKVPVVEKVIEKTEVVREVPIVTEIVREIAVTDGAEEIVRKVNEGDFLIARDKIEGNEEAEKGLLDRAVSIVDNRTSFLINKVSNLSEKVANAGNSEVANSTMSTGIIFGGVLSINADPTKIDISAGAGYIVNDTVVPATLSYVEWDAFTAVTLTDLGTADSTDIAINSSSAVVQQRSYTNSQLRSNILLGGVDHTGGTVRNTFSIQVPSFAPATSVRDLARAVGDLNISGNTFGAASTNLTISKTSGQSFSFGRNTTTDKTNPHVISQDAVSPITFNYIFQDGSGGTTVSASTSDINPLNYDDGDGTLGTVGVNDFAFQNILLFPNSNKVFVQYGTTTYNKLEDAINGLASTTFPSLPGFTSAMRRGVLIVKRGTTNLTTSANARFFAADKFGSIAGSVGTGVAPDLSVYVPYTGATTNLDLGANTLTINGTTLTGGTDELTSNSNVLKVGKSTGFFPQIIGNQGHTSGLAFFGDTGPDTSYFECLDGDVNFAAGRKTDLSDGVMRFYSYNGDSAVINMDLLTDEKTFTFPNKNGTFAMTSDISNSLTTYLHSQTSAATTWSVVHNTGDSYPSVTVYSGGYVVDPSSIQITGPNTLTITFGSATAGSVRVIGTPDAAPAEKFFQDDLQAFFQDDEVYSFNV